MRISDVIPVGAIPNGPGPSGQTARWFGADSQENLKKLAGTGAHGQQDVMYEFNRQGYRCPEFNTAANTRIVSIGESSAFGVGLAQSDLFHERFAERLRQTSGKSVVNWNLAGPDKSADYVARMLHLAVPILQPDIVLVLFPPLDRRECMTADGRIVDFVPEMKLDPRTTHPVVAEICERLTDLASPLDDQLDFFRNYRSVAMLLRKRIWVYGFVSEPPQDCPVAAHLDLSRYACEIPSLDVGRDGMHPGPESHGRLSEQFWERFEQIRNG
jgi:hypothetical protein